MRLLLDTHVLLWAMGDVDRLATPVRELIENPLNDVFISAVTGWEIGIKTSIGKLRVPPDLLGRVAAAGFLLVPVTFEDGLAVGALPRHHDDPFDRLLVAQALARQLVLVTADRQLDAYGVQCLHAERSAS